MQSKDCYVIRSVVYFVVNGGCIVIRQVEYTAAMVLGEKKNTTSYTIVSLTIIHVAIGIKTYLPTVYMCIPLQQPIWGKTGLA